jgi:hypothetical protein
MSHLPVCVGACIFPLKLSNYSDFEDFTLIRNLRHLIFVSQSVNGSQNEMVHGVTKFRLHVKF